MRKTKITKITIQTLRRTVVRSSGSQPADSGASEKPAVVPVRPSNENKENKVNE